MKALERKENEEIRDSACHLSELHGLGATKRQFGFICRVVLGAVYRQAGPEDLETF